MPPYSQGRVAIRYGLAKPPEERCSAPSSTQNITSSERATSISSNRTFQHNRFVLAELKTEVDIGRVFVDRLIEDHVAGRLTIEQAAEAKWWTTEMLLRVVDTGVQMHGG